ncbi:hypothetical protein FB446DRAFT_441472 [Lentinula raphanica]|nr:hypothetical protein FB446DRAFT_441472 [Lentinula raphanica]
MLKLPRCWSKTVTWTGQDYRTMFRVMITIIFQVSLQILCSKFIILCHSVNTQTFPSMVLYLPDVPLYPPCFHAVYIHLFFNTSFLLCVTTSCKSPSTHRYNM